MRLKSKYQRDDIVIFSHQQKNRKFRNSRRRKHNNQRIIMYPKNERRIIEKAKVKGTDQNAIKLSNIVLSSAQKFLFKKGSSSVSTATDISLYNLRQDFRDFVNKLPYNAPKTREKSSIEEDDLTDTELSVERFHYDNPRARSKLFNMNFWRDKTNVYSLEIIIELVEEYLFQPCNYSKTKTNITKEERNTPKNKQHDELKSYCVQDKGFRFVVQGNQDYIEKIKCQLGRSPFEEFNYHPSKKFLK